MLILLQHTDTKKALRTVLSFHISDFTYQAIESFTRSRNSLPGLK